MGRDRAPRPEYRELVSTPPAYHCTRCAGSGRVERGTGYALDIHTDACTVCFGDEPLGIDDPDIARAMDRSKERRVATRRLLEYLVLESTAFGGLEPLEAADRISEERRAIAVLLAQADSRFSADAVQDAIELAGSMTYRGRLTTGTAIGEFVLAMAERLAGEGAYEEDPHRRLHARRAAT